MLLQADGSTMHCEELLHMNPAGHFPQKLPQPSGPHIFPAQLGMHPVPVVHFPTPLHPVPAGQAPQLPPQPSGPHCFPEHTGVQGLEAHNPCESQEVPTRHVPQYPPHPSEPQSRFSQFETQGPVFVSEPLGGEVILFCGVQAISITTRRHPNNENFAVMT